MTEKNYTLSAMIHGDIHMARKPYKVINSDIWSIATNSFVNRENDSAASVLMTCFQRYAIPQKGLYIQV